MGCEITVKEISVVLVYHACGRIELVPAEMEASMGVVIFNGKNQGLILGHVTFKIRYPNVNRSLEFNQEESVLAIHIWELPAYRWYIKPEIRYNHQGCEYERKEA